MPNLRTNHLKSTGHETFRPADDKMTGRSSCHPEAARLEQKMNLPRRRPFGGFRDDRLPGGWNARDCLGLARRSWISRYRCDHPVWRINPLNRHSFLELDAGTAGPPCGLPSDAGLPRRAPWATDWAHRWPACRHDRIRNEFGRDRMPTCENRATRMGDTPQEGPAGPTAALPPPRNAHQSRSRRGHPYASHCRITPRPFKLGRPIATQPSQGEPTQ